MPGVNVASTGRRSQVHTEVRSPAEVVLSRVIEYVFGVIEVFLGARFLLLLFGANAEAGFVRFVYDVSDVFMAPFVAVFNTQRVAGATFEWSALVALAVYALVGWGLVAFVAAVTPRSHAETVETVREDDTLVQ